jgi:outer membrane protein assembly factor BamB
MEFLMKQKSLIVAIFLFSIIISGCAKKFSLLRGEEVSQSQWIYPRADAQSAALIDSHFKGQLNLQWERKVSEIPIGPLNIGGGKLIYCGAKGRIFFFNLPDGQYRGRLKYGRGIQTGVIVVDSLAYLAVGPSRNQLICLNLYNRKTIWAFSLKDVTGTPIINDKQIFVSADSGTIYCLDRFNGTRLWHKLTKGKSLAGPSYDNGTIYWPLDNGDFHAYNVQDSSMIFQLNLNQPLVSKAAIEDKVYIGSADGGFFAIEKETGKVLWQRELPWPIWTSPAVDGQRLIICDNGGFIRALSKDDGRTLWEFKTNGVIVASPIIVGDYILFASLDKNVYCLDKNNGLLISKRELKNEIRFPAVSDGERIYFAAQDGTIQCFGD